MPTGKKRGRDRKPRKPGSGGKRRGAGRPAGVSESLPRGAVGAIHAANLAEEHDPLAQEAVGVLLAIMRGQVRFGAMSRLGAARDLLDRRRGKAVQPEKHDGEVVHRVVIERAGDEPKPDAGD